MIRQIDYLRNFDIYRNFQWGGLPIFAKRNLLYGWNYSGKTTLSRLFQILERPERMASWPNATFSIGMDDGSQVTNSTLAQPPKTRVFNRDFVLANFAQEHTAPAVFILGAENRALRESLAALNRKLERVIRIESDFLGQTVQAKESIDQLGTDKARDVSGLLGDRNFRRPKLIQRIEEVRSNSATFILNDNDVSAKYQICRSTNEWTTLATIQYTLPDFTAFSHRITAKLIQTASNRAMERLRANRPLESWVRMGLELHQGSQECEFCGSKISTHRLTDLQGHFSQEYEALVREITALIEECRHIRLDIPLPDERDLAPDLKAEFIGLKERLQNWVVWAQELQANFITALSQKQTSIESAITLIPDLRRVAEGEQLLGQINELIPKHNRMVGALEQTKSRAKTALEQHYASLLFRDNDLASKEALLAKRRERADKCSIVKSRIVSLITALELQVRQQSIGAANLNTILRYLLAGNNIEVAAIGEGFFEFRRDGIAADKLSDGEKTAIAFAYFLTSLEANGAALAETIVFVDDPISSLDSNHIYAVYALISTRLDVCRQVFLSTHNSELFNLMKDGWLSARERYANNDETCAYYVRRILDGNARWSATLEDLPALLRKYKSEYHFIFAQLHTFANAPTASLHEAYTAPNLLRKFLEAYLGFKKPSVSKWSAKLDLIFNTPEECHEIQRFADDSSHLQNLTRTLQQPDFITSAQRCVGMVLSGLKTKDPEHYESLCVVIGATP